MVSDTDTFHPTSAARLRKLVRHVNTSLTARTCSATTSPEERKQIVRHFCRGVLAHLLLVPAWTVPPGVLLGSLVAAGAPLGGRGVMAVLGLGSVLATGPPNAVRAITGIACAKRQARALVGAFLASFLCLIVSIRDGYVPRIPAVFNFVSKWAPHFYKECELRGALNDIRAGGKSFFGFHPHGCLSIGFSINGVWNSKFMEHAGRTLWLCDPMLRRRNPGFRILCEAYEADDHVIEACEPKDFKKFMSRGETVCFVPGGFVEACVFEHGVDTVYLNTKKGFVKYCLQFGYRLHPVYTFGECNTYYTFTGLQKARLNLAKNNVPALAFFGWPILPIFPLPSARILTYVGRGIDLPHIPEPKEEDVNHWHKIYTEALQRLFEENKADAGFPDAQLRLM